MVRLWYSLVQVRINDDGVAPHAEFEGKYDIENSCPVHLPWDLEVDHHGTAVASMVAGNANSECAVGIAPGSTISSCVGPSALGEAPELLTALLEKGETGVSFENGRPIVFTDTISVHISVNSWGPNVCPLKPWDKKRRLQECIFNPDHEESPCAACGDFTNFTDACEQAVNKYCALNHADDETACESC